MYAPGSDGRLALSTDEGRSWKVVATPSSWPLAGVVFADRRFGLALVGKYGRRILWQTKDGGASWQRRTAGTSHARAVTMLGKRIALLIDAHGIRRSILGGLFKPVARHIKAFAENAEFDHAGSAVFAYGAHVLLRSTDAGAHWRALRLPRSGRHGSASIVSVSFVSRSRGCLLDRWSRLWLTRDGGRRWRQLLSTGTGSAEDVYFANARDGFLEGEIAGFDYSGEGEDRAYVLHTSDGGVTWAPESVGFGWLASAVVASGSDAAVLLQEPDADDEGTMFYAATNGGAVGARHPRLVLHASQRTVSERELFKHHGAVRVTITGKLSTGAAGARIVVSRRPLEGWMWRRKVVRSTAGGRFSTSWPVGRTSVFVAQWAGGERHSGVGSRPLTITVHSR